MRNNFLISLMGLYTMMFSSMSQAQEQLVRQYHYGLENFDEVIFESGAGSMEVEFVDGNDLEIELRLEEKGYVSNRTGWFKKKKDISDVVIEEEFENRKLILHLEEINIHAHWTIRMPSISVTQFFMRLGDITADIGPGDGDLEFNVEVGNVDIDTDLDEISELDVYVGIGAANIKNNRIDNDRRKRKFMDYIFRSVSPEHKTVTGNGNQFIKVDVGVGGAKVHIN